MRIVLLLVSVSLLSGCLLLKQNVQRQDVPKPLDYEVTESPLGYLDRSLRHYSGTSKVVDHDAVLYKLPGAAKYKQSLAKILKQVEHACLNQYGGKIYTKEYRGEFLSETNLVNYLGGDAHAIRVAYKNGDKLRLPPYAVGIGPLHLTSKKIRNILSPKSPVTWPDVYEYGFCATKKYGSGLYDYHFAVEYFTTREEHNGPEDLKPLYVTYFHNGERIKTVEGRKIQRYLNQVGSKLATSKEKVLYYYSEYQDGELQVKLRLTSKEWNGGNVLGLHISGQNNKPVTYQLGDFSNVSSPDGTTYAIAVNAEGLIGRSSSECPFLNDQKRSVLINPGVKCSIKIPVVIGGLPFKDPKMELTKGMRTIQLDSFTKYDQTTVNFYP
jgi:hypothetical protein